MTLHRFHILEVVATEIAVEASSEEQALAHAERGAYTQRHRLVLSHTTAIGYPPMEWDEFVATSRAEMRRREIVVDAWDEAEAKREARKAGAA